MKNKILKIIKKERGKTKMNKLVKIYVVQMTKNLRKDLNAKQKEQIATSFFADILGDFRSNNLTNEEVYFLHEELRALLGWDF